MNKYSFKIKSSLDDNLTNSWHNWQDHYTKEIPEWEVFLETIPEILLASYDKDTQITHLLFKDESDLSLFLLRWS